MSEAARAPATVDRNRESRGAAGGAPPHALSGPRLIVLLATLTAVYFLAGKLGLALAFVHASATAVWPPTGIALAAVLLYGFRVWPAILAGAFLVNVTTAGTAATSLGIATGNTLEAVIGAWLVRRYAGGTRVFQRPQGVFQFAILAAASAIVSASVGLLSLWSGGLAETARLPAIWLTWWLGDLVGALIFAPFILLWAGPVEPRLRSRSWLEAAGLAAAIVATGWAVFANNAPIAYMSLPPLIWASFRFGRRGAVTAAVALSAIALSGTLSGHGPFVRESPNESLLFLQTFFGVITLIALVVAADVREREHVENALRRARDELEHEILERTRSLREAIDELEKSRSVLSEAQKVAHIGSWEWDVGKDRVSWSDELFRIYGLEPQPIDYQGFLARVHPEDRERVDVVVRQSFESGEPFEMDHRIVRPDGAVRLMHARGRVIQEAGTTTGMLGTGQDITERREAEEALRQSEERFRLLAEHATDMITLHALDGTCTYASPAARELTGYDPEDLVGRGLREIQLASGERLAPVEQMRAQIEAGQVLKATHRIRRKDGAEVWAEATARAVKDVEGVMQGIVAVTRDVTERVRGAQLTALLERVTAAAGKARGGEEALRAAIEEVCAFTGWPIGHVYVPASDDPSLLLPTGIWAGEQTSFSTFRQVTAATPLRFGEGLPGRVAASGTPAWIPDVTRDPNFPRARAATDIGVAAGFAFPVRADRDVVAVLEFFTPQVLPPDEPFLAVVGDIGTRLGQVLRRLEAEAGLRRSEQRHRFLADYSSDLISVLTPDGVCTYASPAARSLLGFGPEELVGQPAIEFVHPEDVQRVTEARRAILRSLASQSVIFRLKRKAGGWIWAETTGRGVRAPVSGDVESIVTVTRNITERVRAAEAMRLLQRVTAIANEATTVESAMKMALEVICEHTDWRIGHAYIPSTSAAGDLMSTDIWHVKEPEILPDIRVLTEATPLAIGEGLPGRVLAKGNAEWISDVRRDPGFLRRSAAESLGLHAAMAFPFRAGGEVLAVLELFSTHVLPRDEALVRVMENVGVQLGQLVARQRVEAALKESEVRFRALAETANEAILTIDDESRIVYCNPAVSRIFGHDCEGLLGKSLEILMPERFRLIHREGLRTFLETGEGRILNETVELTGLHRDGHEIPIELSIAAWSTADRPYFTGIVRDVTARKEAEAMLTEKMEELARSNAELALFSYVASHDLREPLRTVASNLQLLERQLGGRLDPGSERSIRYALDGAHRLQMLIDDLLAYSRVGTEGRAFEPVDAGEVVDRVLESLSATIEAERAEVTRDQLPTVVADPSQLAQLFQNLLSNALKFHDTRAPRVHVSAERREGDWIFSVRDNGIGFDPENAEHVFTIFQRLHAAEEFPGTGIGLAICRKIVERHGGRIWAESEPGKGSVFRFTIPAEGAHSAA